MFWYPAETRPVAASPVSPDFSTGRSADPTLKNEAHEHD